MGFIGVNNIAPYAITQPPKINGSLTPKKLGLKSEALELRTKDNVELSGYWIKSELEVAKGVIILLHGIGGCKEHFLGLSNELSKKGIETIIFDGRAHGKSGGAFCTYGFKEKKDIAQIVDKIRKQKPNLPIGIWGNSLGGAIAIQALEFDERIKFGIIESTFTDLHQIVFDYKKRILKGIGIRRLSDFALERAGEIADFEPQKIKPIESVKNIEQSIFIAHGDSDKNISFTYGQQLFDNLKTRDKQFVLIEGGGHFDLFKKGGIEYKNKMMDFIQRNLMLPPKDSVEEKVKQILLAYDAAKRAKSQSEDKNKKNLVFMRAFPVSFEEMNQIFGYNNEKGALYGRGEIIKYFANLTIPEEQEYYDKFINICINGKWDADNIRNAFGIHHRILNDTERICEILDKRSDKELQTVFRFIFDGPHPKNKRNEWMKNDLINSIPNKYHRIKRLISDSYETLINENHSH